jgi:hypothetical protein
MTHTSIIAYLIKIARHKIAIPTERFAIALYQFNLQTIAPYQSNLRAIAPLSIQPTSYRTLSIQPTSDRTNYQRVDIVNFSLFHRKDLTRYILLDVQ